MHLMKVLKGGQTPENRMPIKLPISLPFTGREHTTKHILHTYISCIHILHTTKHILLGTIFLLQNRKAETGWHSNTVIHCYRNLFSLSFVTDICNIVKLDTDLLVIFEYFFEVLYGTGDLSKVTFESFEIDEILFIAFRVKLRLKRLRVN